MNYRLMFLDNFTAGETKALEQKFESWVLWIGR